MDIQLYMAAISISFSIPFKKGTKKNSTKGFDDLSLFLLGFHQSSFVLFTFIYKLTQECDRLQFILFTFYIKVLGARN